MMKVQLVGLVVLVLIFLVGAINISHFAYVKKFFYQDGCGYANKALVWLMYLVMLMSVGLLIYGGVTYKPNDSLLIILMGGVCAFVNFELLVIVQKSVTN